MCSQSMRDEAHGAPMEFMKWETWTQAINDLVDIPEPVHLCPHWLGEPTIHPEFNRFVEYAFARNDKNKLFEEFKLHTNAVVFSETRSRLLLHLANLKNQSPETFRFIHFSIDAHSSDVYKVVKGADRQEQVYKNIKRFIELRTELKYEYPFVTIAYVVQPENAHEAEDFLKHWSSAFRDAGCEVQVTTDWPSATRDTIYFRRLNCGDQAKADLLHQNVAQKLGIIHANQPIRSLESF